MKRIAVLLAAMLVLSIHHASSTEFRTTANGPWASAGWQILTDTGWVPSPGAPTVGLLHVYNNVTIDGGYNITGDPVLEITGNLNILPGNHLQILGTTCLSGGIGGGGSLSNAGDLNILGGGINMTGDFTNFGTIYVSYVGGVGSLIGNFENYVGARIVVGPTNTCGGSLQKTTSIIPRTSSASQSVTVYLYGTIHNYGTIEVEANCFLSIYSSGTMDGTIRNNSAIQFNGALDMHSTTFESNVNYCRALGPLAIFGTVTIPGVFLLEGTKLGPGTLRTDQLSWSAPVNDGTLEINGSCDFGSAVSINSATVINNGRASFTGGALNGNGTFINNDTLVIYHDGNHWIEFSPILENHGWISKVTASMLFHGPFNNDTTAVFRNESGSVGISAGIGKGEFHVESGDLNFSNYGLEPGASITGDGRVNLYGGTLYVNTDISVATLSIDGNAILTGSGTKTVRSQLVCDLYYHSNDGSGPLVIDSAATATFGGTNKGTIINYGTFTSFTAGPGAAPYGPSLFKNYGVCYLPQTGGVTCAQDVENYGRIIRTGLTEYRFLDGPFPMTFMNSGTLEVLSGDLRIGVTGLTSSPQVVPIALGGSIHVSPGARFLSSYEISFNGDTLDNGGVVGCNPFSFVRSTPAQILTGGGVVTQMAINGGNVQMVGPQTNSSLTLTSGKIELYDNDLNLGGGSLSGANDSAYIATNGSGRLVRNVGTSFVSFPVGTSSSYNPVTVKTTTGSDSFAVSVAAGIVPSMASTSTSPAVDRTWSISEATPGGNGMITFTTQWNSGEEGAAFVRDSAEGWRNDGSWAMQSGSLTNITPAGYPAVATITTSSLSSWTVANVDTPPLYSPGVIGFGDVYLNSSRTDTAWVKNNNFFTLTIDSVISTNDRFTVTPASAVLAAAESTGFEITFTPDSITSENGSVVFYSNMSSSPDTISVAAVGSLATVSVPLSQGWNLISNPVTRDPGTDSVHYLYPGSVFDYAFGFESSSGYVQHFTLENGVGFWGKFGSPDTNDITGLYEPTDSVIVNPGWNIIGTVTDPVDTGSVLSDPPGLRISPWYGYEGTFVTPTVLQPGKGYWVKASAPGVFIFAPTLSLPSSRRLVGEKSNAIVDEFVVREKSGIRQVLYLETASTAEGETSELPPPGPEGSFDARFESQKSIESMNESGDKVIVIRSSHYPVTISWDTHDRTYILRDGGTGMLFPPRTISGKGELTITNPAVNRLILSPEDAVPHEFTLLQNYPNPFNPSTEIKFSVGKAARTSLEVFDVLGQRVATLFNDNAEPGKYYTVRMDGMNMASGVYFYTLRSGARVNTRKMLLLK